MTKADILRPKWSIVIPILNDARNMAECVRNIVQVGKGCGSVLGVVNVYIYIVQVGKGCGQCVRHIVQVGKGCG